MTDYFDVDAVSASQLKAVYSTNYWKAQIPRKPTPAMELGTLIHTAILEPDLLYSCYTVFEGDRRTKAGREAWNDIQAQGIKPITLEQMTMAETIAENVRQEPHLLFDQTENEMELFTTLMDEPAKAKIDAYDPRTKTLIDVKTIADINKAQRQFWDLHYDLQLAWYEMMLEKTGNPVLHVQVLFIESSAPYTMKLFDVPTGVLLAGQWKAASAMDKLKYQRRMNLDRPPLDIGEIEIPAWLDPALDNDKKSPF